MGWTLLLRSRGQLFGSLDLEPSEQAPVVDRRRSVLDAVAGQLAHLRQHVSVADRDEAVAEPDRSIARPWLDAVGWRLWDGELERGLDRSMEARLTPLMRAAPRMVELLHARDHGMVPLDIKTSTNLWSMQQVADSAPLRPAPGALLEDTYPAPVVAGLATLRGARAAPEASSRPSIGGANPVVTAQRLAGSPAWSVRFAIGPARRGGAC